MSKEKICGIYKITSPKGKIYIGQSIDIYRRWRNHTSLYSKDKFKLFNSLKKHGVSNHKFEIIHVCEPNELNDLETYYIDLFQCFNSKYGLNLQSGGGSKGKCSEETRKRMIASMRLSWKKRVRVLSDSHKDKIRSKLKGRSTMSETGKQRVREANYIRWNKVKLEKQINTTIAN